MTHFDTQSLSWLCRHSLMALVASAWLAPVGALVAESNGPAVGYTSVRLYSYTERKSELSIWRYGWGVDASTEYTTTNRWERTLGADWTLETGGTRRFVERTFWETWDAQACGDGREFYDHIVSSITTFSPWNTNSSSTYHTSSRNWIRPCLPQDLQSAISPISPDASMAGYVGAWIQRRETNAPPDAAWHVDPPLWEDFRSSYTAVWNQSPRVQLTTGPDRSPPRHMWAKKYSWYWIYPTAYDLDRNEEIPMGEITIGGATVKPPGRALIFSANNAKYKQMEDVTPLIPTRKTFRFEVEAARAETRINSIKLLQSPSDPMWPGVRPNALPQRLQYPPGASTTSDDQLLWDVLSNSPLGSQLASAANSVLALGSPAVSVASSGGHLSQATVADRQWLALAFLSRSGNAPAPATLSLAEVDSLAFTNRTSFRLFNELQITAVADGDRFAVTEMERRVSQVGQVPVKLLAGVTLRLRRADGTTHLVGVGITQVNQILSLAGVGNISTGTGHGSLTGGVGTSEVRTIASAQGGLLPAAVHDLIVRGPRSNLSISTAFRTSADQVGVVTEPATCGWQDATTYAWDETAGVYIRVLAQPPVSSPFACFLTIYP